MRTLCEADRLDFYKAWPIVQARHPDVPTKPVLAREWVSLLRCGHLDAPVEPDRAALVINLLWKTVSHASPLV